jgi:2-polyprenyl-3-methyl-5-hydroxy-6-metoxy-1,4-benzoquinol methylase
MSRVDLDFDQSPIRSLAEVAPIDATACLLREELKRDEDLRQSGALNDPRVAQALNRNLYQRIEIPGLGGVTTTSNHDRVTFRSPGPLHTLFGRLTGHEGGILRPLGKWDYLSKLLPDLNGKSVLEIGCASGFFSFKFADRGARCINGIDVWGTQVDTARWLCGQLDLKDRVSFYVGDAFYDPIPRHDIVFLSEVLGHSVVPFHSLFRILGLANEWLIMDEFAIWNDPRGGQFTLMGYPESGGIQWITQTLSERMILSACYLVGVPLSDVTRYRDDRAKDTIHTVWLINTRAADKRRRDIILSESLRVPIETAMGLREPARIDISKF